MQPDEQISELMAEVHRLQESLQSVTRALELATRRLALAQKYRALRAEGPQPLGHAVEGLHRRLQLKLMHAPTLKTQILTVCYEVLSDGVRRSSRELLPELEKRGVLLPGSDPATSLASYLSRDKDRFVSGKNAGGWTLTPFVCPPQLNTFPNVTARGRALEVRHP